MLATSCQLLLDACCDLRFCDSQVTFLREVRCKEIRVGRGWDGRATRPCHVRVSGLRTREWTRAVEESVSLAKCITASK